MTSSSTERILLVDDDQALLDAMRRIHRKRYDLHIACGGVLGLDAIRGAEPFAVVVSDYQMPGMNGIEFLRQVQDSAPDAVRIMLTGNADLDSAIAAVNDGQVFRFLTKPCSRAVFSACLDTALEQHRLQRAERLVLEETVQGSIAVLSDVLSLASPEAFGRSRRVQVYVKKLAARLKLPEPWQYEAAALLSQIGLVAIPSDVIARYVLAEPLTDDQQRMIERHPVVARELLCKIPRLEPIAEMIAHQNLRHEEVKESGLEHSQALGSQILAAALAFDEHISLGADRAAALRAMAKDKGRFSVRLLNLLTEIELIGQGLAVHSLPVSSLRVGMILDQDVRKKDGALIVAKGNTISSGMLERLRNYFRAGSIREVLRVHAPENG